MGKLSELLKILESASHHVVGETIIHAAHIMAPEFPEFPVEMTLMQRLEWIASQLTDTELDYLCQTAWVSDFLSRGGDIYPPPDFGPFPFRYAVSETSPSTTLSTERYAALIEALKRLPPINSRK